MGSLLFPVLCLFRGLIVARIEPSRSGQGLCRAVVEPFHCALAVNSCYSDITVVINGIRGVVLYLASIRELGLPPHKLLAAQKPKMMVAITPPNEKMRMGASPPSSVVPTRSPTFLAYRRRGPLHCGHLKPGPCSSKKRPAHSACKWEITNNASSGYHSRQDQPQRGRGEHMCEIEFVHDESALKVCVLFLVYDLERVDVRGCRCSHSPCRPILLPRTLPRRLLSWPAPAERLAPRRTTASCSRRRAMR
jgi:hypothetical protein